jgi:hypothetical protein
VTVELRMLIFSVVLGLLQIVAASHAASLQRGYRWTASPRDHKVEPLRGVAGRLDRALRNFEETFALFCSPPSSWWRMTRAPTTLSPSGAPGSTSGAASPTCSSTPPGFRWSVRWVERRHRRHRVDRRCPTI